VPNNSFRKNNIGVPHVLMKGPSVVLDRKSGMSMAMAPDGLSAFTCGQEWLQETSQVRLCSYKGISMMILQPLSVDFA